MLHAALYVYVDSISLKWNTQGEKEPDKILIKYIKYTVVLLMVWPPNFSQSLMSRTQEKWRVIFLSITWYQNFMTSWQIFQNPIVSCRIKSFSFAGINKIVAKFLYIQLRIHLLSCQLILLDCLQQNLRGAVHKFLYLSYIRQNNYLTSGRQWTMCLPKLSFKISFLLTLQFSDVFRG